MSAPIEPPKIADNGIPLCEVPERFFDSTKWGEYLSQFRNRQEALRHISQPEPGITGYYRLQRPNSKGARRDDGGAELVANLKASLTLGQLIATGLSSLAIDRAKIPAERWPSLWPNFIENKADGSDVTFSDIRIAEPTKAKTDALLEECIDWLRKQDGKSLKKALHAEAHDRFGASFTERMFNAAYKAVFFKSRGRSRKSPSIPASPQRANDILPMHPPAAAARQGETPVPKTAPGGTVKMIAPPGQTHAIGQDGRSRLVGPDGVVEVPEAEARLLLGAGFVRAEPENKQ